MVAQAMLQNMLTYWQGQVTTEAVTLSADRLALLNVLNWGLRTPPCWSPTYQLIEQVSPLFEQSGLWEDWQAILQQTQQVAQITADEAKAVNVTIMLARLAQRQGNLPQAVSYYKQVILLARHDEVAKARACSNLAYIYAEQGRFWRAEILGCYALQFFQREELLDKLAHTHNHLGVMYTRQEKFELALFHLTQANRLWERQNDKNNLILGLLNLGLLYGSNAKYKLALMEFKKAIHLANELNNSIQLGTLYLNIGYIYFKQNKLKPAISKLQKAQQIFQSQVNQLGLAQVWHIWGLIYSDQPIIYRNYLQASWQKYAELGYQRGMTEVQQSLDQLDSSQDIDVL